MRFKLLNNKIKIQSTLAKYYHCGGCAIFYLQMNSNELGHVTLRTDVCTLYKWYLLTLFKEVYANLCLIFLNLQIKKI